MHVCARKVAAKAVTVLIEEFLGQFSPASRHIETDNKPFPPTNLAAPHQSMTISVQPGNL